VQKVSPVVLKMPKNIPKITVDPVHVVQTFKHSLVIVVGDRSLGYT